MLCMLDVVKYDMSGVCMCISFYMNTVHFIFKCLKLEIILTEYSLKTFVQFSDLLQAIFFIFNEHCC